MKSFKLFFIVGIAAALLNSCSNTEENELIIDPTSSNFNLASKEVPFKAKLFTGQADDALSEICSYESQTDFWAMEHQVGGGNATHLGNFSVDLKFCFHIVFDQNGLPDIEGGFGEYNGISGSTPPKIIAANGDELFVEVREESRLIPIQNEKYSFEFDDVWYIIGGTGRFENASGEFIGYGLVRNDGTGTDHDWKGTIILE